MNNEELFVMQSVFNKKVLSPGAIVRLEGYNFDGEDVTGNFLVQRNELLELHLIGGKGTAPQIVRIDMADMDTGTLRLKLVATNE